MNGDHIGELLTVIAFLAAAVLFVPLATRLGLGSVLGYLTAGVLLGPSVIGVTNEPEQILEFAELGVVFLLFLIGLELNPQRLWSMRRDIFGLGAMQVVICGALIMLHPLLIEGRPWQTAIIAGLGLALSSTALVMQLIEERGAMRLPYGQKTFAVLLMQDIAIVPLLLLVTLLAPGGDMDGLVMLSSVAKAVAAVGAMVVVGHYLLSPAFRLLARFGGTDIMTAGALLVVIAAATAMMSVGLSMAMGAFLAGVLLAESNYRHELEADIAPFRGLLLGLFFLAVGMSIDLSLVVDRWLTVATALVVLIGFKTTVVYGLVRLFGGDHLTATKTGLLLSQGGEFGFVLYTAAAQQGVMTGDDASLLIAIVALSMVTTPFLVRYVPRFVLPARPKAEPNEDYSDAKGDVLIIGFGRFGQLVSQMLLAAGHTPIILDNDAERVEEARRFGARVYYGEGARLDVLRAVGAQNCALIAVCTSPPAATDEVVEVVKAQFGQAALFVRAFDRRHALSLIGHKVDYQRRETFDGALRFGRDALVALGLDENAAKETEIMVRRLDRERFELQRIEGIVEGSRRWREIRPEPYVNRAPEDEEDRKEADRQEAAE